MKRQNGRVPHPLLRKNVMSIFHCLEHEPYPPLTNQAGYRAIVENGWNFFSIQVPKPSREIRLLEKKKNANRVF